MFEYVTWVTHGPSERIAVHNWLYIVLATEGSSQSTFCHVATLMSIVAYIWKKSFPGPTVKTQEEGV